MHVHSWRYRSGGEPDDLAVFVDGVTRAQCPKGDLVTTADRVGGSGGHRSDRHHVPGSDIGGDHGNVIIGPEPQADQR
jgi:hypothetical protein